MADRIAAQASMRTLMNSTLSEDSAMRVELALTIRLRLF